MTEMDIIIIDERDIPTNKSLPRSESLLRQYRAISGNPNGILAVVRWRDNTEFCAWILNYQVKWQITVDSFGKYYYSMGPPRRGTRDQMIDAARDNFPRLFDLILFHPEILDGRYFGDKK